MGYPKKPTPGTFATLLRARRETLGTSVTDLARALGVTPSFVSQIESGLKGPNIEKARAIAKELGIPPEPLEAWVKLRRGVDPEQAALALEQIKEFLGSQAPQGITQHQRLRRELLEEMSQQRAMTPAAGMPTESAPPPMSVLSWASHFAGRQREEPHYLAALGDEGERTVAVPLIASGCDPGPGPKLECPALDVLSIDRALLGPSFSGGDLFAFRASENTASRVRDAIEPGSTVFVARGESELREDQLYAARHDGELVISHVTRKDDYLILVPDHRGMEVEMIPLTKKRGVADVIRGRLVAVVRVWE